MTTHIGRERMEAATWTPPTFRLPTLPRRVKVAVGGRVALVAGAIAVLVTLTAIQPEPSRPYNPRGAGFRWSAVEPDTGRVVPRDEWIAKALAV